MSLFIDLGTNGEIVFGNRDFLMSCACSAGPAFEGGDISCGMRATDGAIEACSLDYATMEPTLRVVGPEGQKPVGICGSGIIDIISELFRCRIINAKGLFIREGDRVRRDEHGMGRFVLVRPENSVNIGMFPDVDLEKFSYIGNSSLTGAYAMVMSDEANAKTAEVAANMTYLELSTHPGYMDSFVAACFLPHTDVRLFPSCCQEG